MFLYELLDEKASAQPAAQALVAEGRRWTYWDIKDRSDEFAGGLVEGGIGRGDRVAIFMDNSPEMVVALYGVLKAGAIFVPINPLTKSEKLTFILKDCEARALISDGHLQPVYNAALAVYRPPLVVLNAPTAADESLSYRTFLQKTLSKGRPKVTIIDQDLAAIIYTSGSTGEPKGVMLSHHNMVSAARSVSQYLGLASRDRILCCLPLAFDYGLYQVLMAFMIGACVVLERSFAFPAAIVKVMAAERVTVFPGVPTIFSILLGHDGIFSAYDCRAVRMITNTAASLPPQHIKRLRAQFPQAQIFSMYGLTECKRVTYLPPEELGARPNSVGRGMPNEEVYLVDPEGQRLPPGSVGELVIRGSHVMRGYWRRPEETAKRLKPGPYPGEMVLYSGDIFHMDEEGYLYFIGRSDDIIKSRGEKVSPKEVENVLYALSEIAEAAVIGVDDEVLGQAVHAFVVLHDDTDISEREIIRYCYEHMESYMVPKAVHIVESLPKTDTGKIRKSGLASLARRRASEKSERLRAV